MKKTAIFPITALFSLTAFGQDLLQCVDPDVLNSLVFNARSQSKMSATRSLPDSLSDYTVPAAFELIGTAARADGSSAVTAFKTAQASDDAFATLLAPLEADGWSIEGSSSPRQTFNLGGQPVSGVVCRNGERRSLSVEDANGVRYASISSYPDTRERECNAGDSSLALRGPAMFEAMRAMMPKLDFPTSARPANGPLSGGISGSGSGSTASTSSRIQSPDTAASLADFLAPQMTTQGWNQDAAWSGTLTAGSTWTRSNDVGEPYWGTLEIIRSGEGIYDVGFMVTSQRP